MDGALWKRMKTPEAQKIGDAAVKKAWNELQQQFPQADISKFKGITNYAKNHTATAEIFFKASSGASTSVFGLEGDIGAHK